MASGVAEQMALVDSLRRCKGLSTWFRFSIYVAPANLRLFIMNSIEQNLEIWRASLMTSIPIAGLVSRNPTAYKWKAPFRCWLIREAAFWRVTDLLTQSCSLHQQGHVLGARILLRSSFETLAVMIYLNHKVRQLLESKTTFQLFSRDTTQLALGSRNRSTGSDAVNVLTMLDKGDKTYVGLRKFYDDLSESAHPNFEGMVWGYSKVDHDEYETHFSNRWVELHGEQHLKSMELCMMAFHHEYNSVWPDLMKKLEDWIVENAEHLEANKNGPSRQE